MTAPLSPAAPSAEHPLIGIARYSLIALAAAMVRCFYVHCVVAVTLIGLILVIEIFLFLRRPRCPALYPRQRSAATARLSRIVVTGLSRLGLASHQATNS